MNTPLQHAERCGRRRPPILRASWRRAPEWWCPECGRTAPVAESGNR